MKENGTNNNNNETFNKIENEKIKPLTSCSQIIDIENLSEKINTSPSNTISSNLNDLQEKCCTTLNSTLPNIVYNNNNNFNNNNNSNNNNNNIKNLSQFNQNNEKVVTLSLENQQQNSCNGCHELKKELADLRKMFFQYLSKKGLTTFSNDISSLNFIAQLASKNENILNPQLQSQTLIGNQQGLPNIQSSIDCNLTSNTLPNFTIPPRLIPYLIENNLISPNTALFSTLTEQLLHQLTQQRVSSTNFLNDTSRFFDQISANFVNDINFANLNNSTNISPRITTNSLLQSIQNLTNNSNTSSNNNNVQLNQQPTKLAELVQAVVLQQRQQINANNKNNNNNNITNNNTTPRFEPQNNFSEPTAADGNETSSSVSSTNTQLMLISPNQPSSTHIQSNQQIQLNNNISVNDFAKFDVKISTPTGATVVTRSNNFMSQFLTIPAISNASNTESNLNRNINNTTSTFLHPHSVNNLNNTSTMTMQQQHQFAQLHASLLIQQQQEQQKATQRQHIQQHLRTQQLQLQQQQIQKNSNSFSLNNTATATNEIHSSEKRRAVSDDYVQNILREKWSEERIACIKIPVPAALQVDPSFRPLSEQQVIQQIVQSKKYENVNVSETMTQLCKKLAEKRVFGSRLMSETTVAAPNHSSYDNLPNEGIIYIEHVCRKVLGHRVKSDEEFWNYFREAMRKLAARCRRVRHAKKKHPLKLTNRVISQSQHQQQIHFQNQLQLQQEKLLFEIKQKKQQQKLDHKQNIIFDSSNVNTETNNESLNNDSAIKLNKTNSKEIICATNSSFAVKTDVVDESEQMDVTEILLNNKDHTESNNFSLLSSHTPLSSSFHTHSTSTPTLSSNLLLNKIKVETLETD